MTGISSLSQMVTETSLSACLITPWDTLVERLKKWVCQNVFQCNHAIIE